MMSYVLNEAVLTFVMQSPQGRLFHWLFSGICLLQLSHGYLLGPSTTIDGCLFRQIDLVLVADDAGLPEYWNDQIQFFHRLLGEFLGDKETSLTRLKVALLIADTKQDPLQEGTGNITTRVVFDLHSLEDTQALFSTLSKTQNHTVTTNVTFQEPAFRYAIHNGATLGTRQDALTVVVIVQRISWHWSGDQFMQDLESFRRPFGSWLMLVDNGRAPLQDLNLLHYNLDTKFGESLYLFPDAYFESELFCRECPPGWFSVPFSELCLHLTPVDVMSWRSGLVGCRSLHDGVSLAMLRSKKLVRDAEALLHSILMSERRESSAQESSDAHIFIGLQRNGQSFSRRFEWHDDLDQYRMYFPRWLPGEPDNFHTENCVMWTFKAAALDSKVMDAANESQRQEILSQNSGWQTVDCIQPIENTRALCYYHNVDLLGNVNLPPPPVTFTPMSLKPVPNVLARGAFAMLNLTTHAGPLVRFLSPTAHLTYLRSLMEPKDDQALAANLQMAGFENRSVEAVLDTMPRFHCQDGDGEVAYVFVCDHVPDCEDESDETICLQSESRSLQLRPSGYRLCTFDEFSCNTNFDSPCMPNSAHCDLFPDCDTGVDENFCYCKYHTCADGSCVPNRYGREDCDVMTTDGSLDEMCITMCNRTSCVTADIIANGVTDCHGPEGHVDHVLGQLEGFECPDEGLTRWAPKCVFLRDRFGEMIGCPFMEHLRDCEFFPCPEGYAKCPDSFCIPVSAIRDGESDCPLKEDELYNDLDFFPEGTHGLFQCTRTRAIKAWIHPDLVCDGLAHCPGGEDELECDVTTCAEGFLCLGGTLVVSDYDKTKHLLHDIQFVDRRVRYVDLSHVQLPDFFQIYPKGRLMSILELYLSDCSITSLQGPGANLGPVQDFVTLMTLDVSQNRLTAISNNSVLAVMTNLQRLDLSGNVHLTRLETGAIASVLLRVLDLSWTGFTSLDRHVFTKFQYLSRISLRGTLILRLRTVFAINTNLQFLDLRDMPLQEIDADVFSHVTKMEEMQTSSYRLCCAQIRGDTIPSHTCHAPQDVVSSCSDMIREPVMRVMLWVVGLCALVGNAVVIAFRLVFDRNHLKKSYGLFVAHLSLADFLMGVYLLQIALADVKYRGDFVLHGDAWMTSAGCKAAGFLSTLSSETSAMFIFFITVDRFLVIRFPLGQYRLNITATCVCSTVVWAIGFLLSVLPLLPPLDHWVIYNSNAMCLGLPLDADRKPGWQYSQAVFVGFNFALFLLIAAGQFAIYRSMSVASASRMALVGKVSEVRRRQEMAVARHLSFVAISDFLCWFPIGFMGLLTLGGKNVGHDAYAWSMVLILPINSALNPILYTLPVLKKKWNDFGQKRTGLSRGTSVSRAGSESTVSQTSQKAVHDVTHLLTAMVRHCTELNDVLESSWRQKAHPVTACIEFKRLQEHIKKLEPVFKSQLEETTHLEGSLPSND